MEEQENINAKRNMSENNFEPVLIGVEKHDPSSYIRIDKDEFKIGRGRTNNEIIAHVSISRQHCIFKKVNDKGEWTVQDLSSSGTFVNGSQLRPGEMKIIKIGDLIQLGMLSEFSYKFGFDSSDEPLVKRPKMTVPELDLNHIVMRQKTFEESQQLERSYLAEQMKAEHTKQLELKNELQRLLNDRDTGLGEKDQLNGRIHALEKNIEEVKLAEMNLEKLNRELSQRLDKERQEFEIKLTKEKKKVEEALEMSKREKEMLEIKMKEQLEKLRNEQRIECRKLTESLSEEKKTAEKLQSEKVAFAQKVKEMEDALSKIEAKANELQSTLEKQNAFKTPQVVALDTAAENVAVIGESNLPIFDTIDLTVDTPNVNNAAVASRVHSTNEDVFSKVGDIMDEQLTCSICSELFVTAITLNCTHTFCKNCINTWMKKKKECPVCRTAIAAMNRSLVLDNFIDKMVENLSEEYKKRRTEIVEERREKERLANEAANQGSGKKGRGRPRGTNANAIPNRSGNTSIAATSGTNTTSNNPDRTERTDGIQHRGPQARNNPDWNNASSSGDQLQQPATTGSTSNYQQTTTAATHSTDNTYDQTNDHDACSTSTDTDGDITTISSSDSSSQSSEDSERHTTDIEIVSDGDGYSTDNSWGRMDFTMDNDYESEPSNEDYVEGLPGVFYGGYGVCYKCGHTGHWAPGCPYR